MTAGGRLLVVVSTWREERTRVVTAYRLLQRCSAYIGVRGSRLMAIDEITRPPKFSSEREEAEWWDTHPDFIVDAFRRAQVEGRLSVGTMARRMAASDSVRTGIVMVDAEDLTLAASLARRKGLERESYLRALLHAALLKDQASLDQTSAA